jgi:uncharacterized protein YkwD
MAGNAARGIGAFLAVIIIVFSCTTQANAGWESGLNVAAVNSSQNESVSGDKAEKAFAERVLNLVNSEREKSKITPLGSFDALCKAADTRACESAVLFSHVRPDGRSCSSVFSDNALSYSFAGENLAYGYVSPEDIVSAWMNSKAHRENILNKNFVYAELGYFKDKNGVTYCSMLFYTPQTK